MRRLPVVHADALSALCAACGACCDGTLFDVVPVAEGEAARLRARGLDPFPRDHDRDLVVAAPCTAHAGGCAVYADRPAACAAYRCRLLREVEAGEVAIDAARALLDAARALADDLRRRVGADHLGLRRAIELRRLERAHEPDLFADAAELGALLERIAGDGP